MKSIQQFLRVRVLWGSSVILAAGMVLLGLAIRDLDVREFDSALENKARTFATLVLREGRRIEVEFAGEYMPEFETAENAEYFQFRLLDGSVIERSDMLGKGDLPFLPEATSSTVFMDLRLPDGRRGRFAQITLLPRAGENTEIVDSGNRFRIPDSIDSEQVVVVLGIARSREALDGLLLKIYAALAGTALLLIGLIAFVVQRALGKGFHPIAEMNAQIRELEPTGLDKRVELADTPIELTAALSALNGFIERSQAAFQRERRFTSDVAHELRTPIAEFRTACEVGAKWSDDPHIVRRRFENLLDSVGNMQQLVDSLLELSRLDRGAIAIEAKAVPVATVIGACWGRVHHNGGEPELRLDNRVDPSLTVHTDAKKLEVILQNLLENADSYGVPDTAVTCTVTAPTGGGGLVLCVSNRARDLSVEDLDHIFERFWRKDTARTAGKHAGLGLSIVQYLAALLSIELEVDLTADSVFTVSLAFSETVAA